VIEQDVYRRAGNRQAALIARKLGLGHAWINPAASLTTAAMDFTLPSTVTYGQVLSLVYANGERPLTKIARDVVIDRRGFSGSSPSRLYEYALDKDATGRVVVMFERAPGAAEDLKAYVSTMPEQWEEGSATPPTIAFSEMALRALELMIAADVAVPLGSDIVTALNIDKSACVKDYRQQAMALLSEEELAVIRLKRSRGVYNYDWFTAWGWS